MSMKHFRYRYTQPGDTTNNTFSSTTTTRHAIDSSIRETTYRTTASDETRLSF